MRLSRAIAVAVLVVAAGTAGGCAAFDDLAFWRGDQAEPSVGESMAASDIEAEVRDTVDTVKVSGNVSVISSRALRLPSRPLNSITAYNYAFPMACGGHHFRVYEANGTQILEFEYVPSGGRSYVIRDYITGPSPFVQPGLWTAYDHTADGVSGMTMLFEARGSGILRGTYSQGPVTGLDVSLQRVLANAYQEALHDTYRCRT